jgi:hypothetical protein
MVQPLVSRMLGRPTLDPTPDPPVPRDLPSALAANEQILKYYPIAHIPRNAGADARVQERLDSFLELMAPTVRTPEGEARVTVPFGEATSNYPGFKVVEPAASRHVREVLPAVGLTEGQAARIRAGRGTPAEIRLLTQGLIDAGYLSRDRSQPIEMRIRQLMFDHRITADCAGYVQQAYLYAAKTTRAAVGFKDALDEDLSMLAPPAFRRVGPDLLRPGDILSLEAPPAVPTPTNPRPVRDHGHRLIVYSASRPSGDEISALKSKHRDISGIDAFADSPGLLKVALDSSYGSGGDALRGGVARLECYYDTQSKKWFPDWADEHSPERLDGSHLMGHPVIGVFRGTALTAANATIFSAHASTPPKPTPAERVR